MLGENSLKMSFEEGLKHERTGDYFSALSFYRQELDSGRFAKEAVRGLFRSTLKVGDIRSLSLELSDLCQVSGISKASEKLMQGRLQIEIGEVERSKNFVNDIDSKLLGVSEVVELDLLRANTLALEFKFDSAIELLKRSDSLVTNHLRRIAELEIAAHRPENAVTAIKIYVKELNRLNRSRGISNRYITSSGLLFNLANQIWLEQKFPETKDLPSLIESMKILQRASMEKFIHGEEIFEKVRLDSSCFIEADTRNNSSLNGESLSYMSKPSDAYFKGKANNSPEALLMFLDRSPTLEEFSRIPLQKWENQFRLPPSSHIFIVEESGFAIWTNFKACAGCRLITSWVQFLLSSKERGDKNFISHRFPGGRLTQLLARNFEQVSDHSPVVILRNSYRRGRILLDKY